MKLVQQQSGLFADPLFHLLDASDEILCGLARVRPNAAAQIRRGYNV